MSKITKAWLTSLVALAGLGVAFVYAPVGVGLSFVGVLATVKAMFALNHPATRLALLVAIGANAASVFVATGEPLLGGAAFIAIASLVPSEAMLGWRPFYHFQGSVGFVISAALVAASWPFDWWTLAVVPNLGIGGMVAVQFLLGRKEGTEVMRTAKLRVGQTLPDVRLPQRDGDGEFVLSEHRGHHVLLVFVRGDWCPVCHVMMRIISRESETLQKHGVRLALITPTEGTAEEEFVRRLGLKPGMLYDENAALARSLGLIHKEQRDGKDVPMPVTVLVDPEGVVRNISRPDDVTAFSNESKIVATLRGELPAAA